MDWKETCDALMLELQSEGLVTRAVNEQIIIIDRT